MPVARTAVALVLSVSTAASAADNEPPPGFTALFNGKDLSGWKVPEGDGGHWKVVDGAIDYDAQSEAKGDKSLWLEREFGDFELHVDWRLKEAPYINPNVPYILPDGTHARDIHGKEMKLALPDADSGIYLRGLRQPPGQHLVLADRLGRDVRHPHRPEHAARAPRRRHAPDAGRPSRRRVEPVRDHRPRQHGPDGPQRQGRDPGRHDPRPAGPRAASRCSTTAAKRDGQWTGPPSLLQYKNIFIKELGPGMRPQRSRSCGPR